MGCLFQLGIIRFMSLDTGFDFDAADGAPFRMRPDLRKLPAGARHLTLLPAGSRHQREKLAVLSAFWADALCVQNGFDAAPALHALCQAASAEHPRAWTWDGERAHAIGLGTAVNSQGEVEFLSQGGFGVGDEISRCLLQLPPAWRLTGLLSLTFAEDFAIVDGASGCINWLAVALPSHWEPQDKIGRHFSAVHEPVADSELLIKASDALVRLVTGADRWERFVWNITDQPRLHVHPARSGGPRWAQTAVDQAWWRTERQTFLPVLGHGLAVFTTAVDVQRLETALSTPGQWHQLHDAVASMSPAVLVYRGLLGVREPMLNWLHERAARAERAASATRSAPAG